MSGIRNVNNLMSSSSHNFKSDIKDDSSELFSKLFTKSLYVDIFSSLSFLKNKVLSFA